MSKLQNNSLFKFVYKDYAFVDKLNITWKMPDIFKNKNNCFQKNIFKQLRKNFMF